MNSVRNLPAVNYAGRSEAAEVKVQSAWPWQHARPRRVPELVRLFHATNALNAEYRPFVLQFIGSTRGEGTSTLAAGFAMLAATERAKSVLLVDCGGAPNRAAVTDHEGPSLIRAFQETGSTDSAIQPVPAMNGLAVATLARSANPLLELDGGELRELWDVTKRRYPIIVLDCPPASTDPDSLGLAQYADGTVLVVRAESTRQAVIGATKEAIERFGGQLVGVVFNRRKTYIPDWLYRLLT
jgi:Mrp family chromosome partitioning ATPase